MGLAFTCGLDKVVIPFLDKGIPVEYELIRSISTVAGDKRKRIGVVKTDAPLFPSFSMQGPTPEALVITELKKQYEVIEVDPTKPITEKFDVLLAVQPSSLSPEAMDNFVAAVKMGQPVAIFEDPLPYLWQDVVGTAQEKRPGGPMAMFGGGAPQPKGDITQLWRLLGVEIYGDQIIWQNYNPEKQIANIPPEWIFIDEGLKSQGAPDPFNEQNNISSGLSQVLFIYPGAIRKADGVKDAPEALATTGKQTGTIGYEEVTMGMRGGGMDLNRIPTHDRYIMAAIVDRTIEEDTELLLGAADDKEKDIKLDGSGKTKIRAVVVSDIDCLGDPFFSIRAMGQEEELQAQFNFQNVTLVLNILDDLADDKNDFIAIRKRSRPHRLLTKIEHATADYREKAAKEEQEFKAEAEKAIAAANTEFREKLDEIRNRTDLPPAALRQLLEREEIRLRRLADVKITQLGNERDVKVRQNQLDLALQVRGVQDQYKFAAVTLPVVLPLLLGLFVYFRRRQAEQEGVSKTRLRYGKVESPHEEAIATAETQKTQRKKVNV
jgi:ABC-2 type transport system permease protein